MSAKNTGPYLLDGSGCEKCNYTGNFGCWLADKWNGYPQIKCGHCGPTVQQGKGSK